jgi:hypothetical protein
LKAPWGQDSLSWGASAWGGWLLLDGVRCGGAEGLDREEETGVVQVEQVGELGGLWSVRGMLCELAAVDRLRAGRKAGIRDPSWWGFPGDGLVDAVGFQIRGRLRM